MANKKDIKMTFVEWYDWEYVNDDDPNMKVNTYAEIIKERYELRNKNYSEAYYDLASIFDDYLRYLGIKNN